MATLDFFIHTGADFALSSAGSGLGFFGDDGYGASVAVGTYQGRTFITDPNGLVKGAEAPNVKWLNATSGILGQTGTGIGLQAIPAYQSTLNVRFTHSSAIQTQNVELRIYDRSDINNAASGVTTKVAEIIHPSPIIGPTGSGDEDWITPAGSAVVVDLAESPGISGLYAGDGVTAISTKPDIRHDWYICVSASPDSIGAKKSFGLNVSLEYL